MGMVGSINAPTSGNTYAAFEAAALKIGSSQAKVSDPQMALTRANTLLR